MTTSSLNVNDLLTVRGFINRYMQHLRDKDCSQIEAYELTEHEYEQAFERRRYSCYNSFRIGKNRLAKRGDR